MAEDEILKRPEIQAEIDRRVTQAVKKVMADAERERQAAIERAETEVAAEQAKQSETSAKALYEKERARAEELQAQLKARQADDDRRAAVEAALDAANATADERRFVSRLKLAPGDVAAALDDLRDHVATGIQSAGGEPARKPSAQRTRADFASIEERTKFIAEHGLDAYKALDSNAENDEIERGRISRRGQLRTVRQRVAFVQRHGVGAYKNLPA